MINPEEVVGKTDRKQCKKVDKQCRKVDQQCRKVRAVSLRYFAQYERYKAYNTTMLKNMCNVALKMTATAAVMRRTEHHSGDIDVSYLKNQQLY